MANKETVPQYRWLFRFIDSIDTDNYNNFVGQRKLYNNGTYHFYANGVGGENSKPTSPPKENEKGEWERYPVNPFPPEGFELVTQPRTT